MRRCSSLSCLFALLPDALLPAPLPGSPPSVLIAERSPDALKWMDTRDREGQAGSVVSCGGFKLGRLDE